MANSSGAARPGADRLAYPSPTVVPDKSADIVVYCASKTCQNSYIAASVLRQIGYANVAVYAGGEEDWVEAGSALEKGSAEVTA